MKPAMRQTLTLYVPQLDSKGKPVLDKYSKPLTISEHYNCRTREHGETLRTSQLRIEDSRDEIDVNPNTPVQEGLQVNYTTISGEQKKGSINAITETTNLTASRVLFKTCVIDG